METPHHIFWHTAHLGLSIGEKQAVIRAYETLHAHGILHNNISAHNICIGQRLAQAHAKDSEIHQHGSRSRYERYAA
jgi:hypothetical protein